MASLYPSPKKRKAECTMEWEVEAKRQVAGWRQRFRDTKALVRAYFLVGAAQQQGVDLPSIKDQKTEALINFKMTASNAEKKFEEWERRAGLLEELVYSHYLLANAERKGIRVSQIARDPVQLYISLRESKVDKATQATTPCVTCTSFLEDICMEEETEAEALDNSNTCPREGDSSPSRPTSPVMRAVESTVTSEPEDGNNSLAGQPVVDSPELFNGQ